MPLSHKLKSGDQVEILTSKAQHVQPSWINFVTTAKAKSKIQAILRRNGREIRKQGEETLNSWLKMRGMELSNSIVDKLCDYHDLAKPDDLYMALGDKTIILGDSDLQAIKEKQAKKQSGGLRRFVPFLGKKKKDKDEQPEPQQQPIVVGKDFDRKKPVIVTEDNIRQLVFPHCCHPIPGDDILGFIDNKGRIEIHKRTCPVATRLKASFGNRLLDTRWSMHKQMFFDATIEIKGIDRKGMLRDVANIISDQLGVNIHKVTISSDNGIFDGTIELRVHDRDEVKVIMDSLKSVNDLQEIQQII